MNINNPSLSPMHFREEDKQLVTDITIQTAENKKATFKYNNEEYTVDIAIKDDLKLYDSEWKEVAQKVALIFIKKNLFAKNDFDKGTIVKKGINYHDSLIKHKDKTLGERDPTYTKTDYKELAKYIKDRINRPNHEVHDDQELEANAPYSVEEPSESRNVSPSESPISSPGGSSEEEFEQHTSVTNTIHQTNQFTQNVFETYNYLPTSTKPQSPGFQATEFKPNLTSDNKNSENESKAQNRNQVDSNASSPTTVTNPNNVNEAKEVFPFYDENESDSEEDNLFINKDLVKANASNLLDSPYDEDDLFNDQPINSLPENQEGTLNRFKKDDSNLLNIDRPGPLDLSTYSVEGNDQNDSFDDDVYGSPDTSLNTSLVQEHSDDISLSASAPVNESQVTDLETKKSYLDRLELFLNKHEQIFKKFNNETLLHSDPILSSKEINQLRNELNSIHEDFKREGSLLTAEFKKELSQDRTEHTKIANRFKEIERNYVISNYLITRVLIPFEAKEEVLKVVENSHIKLKEEVGNIKNFLQEVLENRNLYLNKPLPSDLTSTEARKYIIQQPDLSLKLVQKQLDRKLDEILDKATPQIEQNNPDLSAEKLKLFIDSVREKIHLNSLNEAVSINSNKLKDLVITLRDLIFKLNESEIEIDEEKFQRTLLLLKNDESMSHAELTYLSKILSEKEIQDFKNLVKELYTVDASLVPQSIEDDSSDDEDMPFTITVHKTYEKPAQGIVDLKPQSKLSENKKSESTPLNPLRFTQPAPARPLDKAPLPVANVTNITESPQVQNPIVINILSEYDIEKIQPYLLALVESMKKEHLSKELVSMLIKGLGQKETSAIQIEKLTDSTPAQSTQPSNAQLVLHPQTSTRTQNAAEPFHIVLNIWKEIITALSTNPALREKLAAKQENSTLMMPATPLALMDRVQPSTVAVNAVKPPARISAEELQRIERGSDFEVIRRNSSYRVIEQANHVNDVAQSRPLNPDYPLLTSRERQLSNLRREQANSANQTPNDSAKVTYNTASLGLTTKSKPLSIEEEKQLKLLRKQLKNKNNPEVKLIKKKIKDLQSKQQQSTPMYRPSTTNVSFAGYEPNKSKHVITTGFVGGAALKAFKLGKKFF